MLVWSIILGGLAVIAITGLPIGIGLALTGLAILRFAAGGGEQLAITSVWNVFTDFTFSAVPIFIFMGEVLLVSGVSTRMYNALSPFFQRVPGRLLHTNIVVCTLFGAVSGASTSTAAAVGSVAYPELRQRGYHRPTVVATLAAGGTLGLLIPPSLSLLIYGATQGVSIGRLFLAGILPGLMLSAMFMAFIYAQNRRRDDLTPRDSDAVAWPRALAELARTWPFALLIFAVLGTMYLGLATATEAAGLGVVAAILVGFTWGTLTPRKCAEAFLRATIIFGAIGIIVLGALVLAQSLSVLGVPQQVMETIGGLGVSKYVVLILVTIVYLILGCFFDGISLLLMTIPIVFPVMKAVGFDVVWTGVFITIMIEIGMLTPPVGMNLFVLVAITDGEVALGEAARAAAPYWMLMLGGVLILTLVPDIALVLPNLVMGRG
jgi:tripartite ATP-independent transporter DctM subunit